MASGGWLSGSGCPPSGQLPSTSGAPGKKKDTPAPQGTQSGPRDPSGHKDGGQKAPLVHMGHRPQSPPSQSPHSQGLRPPSKGHCLGCVPPPPVQMLCPCSAHMLSGVPLWARAPLCPLQRSPTVLFLTSPLARCPCFCPQPTTARGATPGPFTPFKDARVPPHCTCPLACALALSTSHAGPIRPSTQSPFSQTSGRIPGCLQSLTQTPAS